MSIIETHDIAGMTRDHCARAVRAEVSAIDGVTDVDVDLNSGVVVPLPRPLGRARVAETPPHRGTASPPPTRLSSQGEPDSHQP
jgi:copper chaperone CopZ